MKQTSLTRLKRIECAQDSAGLDPQTAALFDPIFAVIVYHYLPEDGPRGALTEDDVAALPQAGSTDISTLSDAELSRLILHGFAPGLDKMLVTAGAAPRNGRDLNAWVKSPATLEALATLYDAIPAEFKRQRYFPDTLAGYLEQARKSAAKASVETILVELEHARRAALEKGHIAAAVAASMSKAKVAGLIIDKQERGAPGDFSQMSDDELRGYIADHLGIGASGEDVTPKKAKPH
jgi:hypothetical protein